MTTALSVMRQAVGKKMGEVITGACDAGATTTSIPDADLAIYEDDELNNRWLLMTSGSQAGEQTKISDFAQTNGVITLKTALTGAPAAGDTFEIHKYNPDDIEDALNEAITKAYPEFCQLLTNEDLTSKAYQHDYAVPSTLEGRPHQIWIERGLGWDFEDNKIKNGGFEDWTGSSPDDWDTPTGITLSAAKEENEEPVKYGEYSAKCVVAANTAASHYQTLDNPAYFDSQKCTYSEWVYCRTATRVKVAIVDNVGSTPSTVYHQGKGWELLKVVHTVTTSPTSVKGGVTVDSGAAITIYRDNVMFVRGERQADRPYDLNHHWVYDEGAGVVRFREALPEDRSIRLMGKGLLSTVSADTDTVELDEPEVQYLYAEAIAYMYWKVVGDSLGTDSQRYEQRRLYWQNEAERLRWRYKMRLPSAQIGVAP